MSLKMEEPGANALSYNGTVEAAKKMVHNFASYTNGVNGGDNVLTDITSIQYNDHGVARTYAVRNASDAFVAPSDHGADGRFNTKLVVHNDKRTADPQPGNPNYRRPTTNMGLSESTPMADPAYLTEILDRIKERFDPPNNDLTTNSNLQHFLLGVILLSKCR